tara:strand:- start:226 stop:504 length:279 start_codon:yes stop_codon:yes gene_type:complete
MAFTENLDIFFEHFSTNVFYNGAFYKGNLEQPDEIIADGVVLTTDYELTVKNSDLGFLNFDSEIEIDDVKYKVRNVRKIDDGILCKISLNKV